MRSISDRWYVQPCRTGLSPEHTVSVRENSDPQPPKRDINEETNAGIILGNHIDALPYWSERYVLTGKPSDRQFGFGWSANERRPIPPASDACSAGSAYSIYRGIYTVDPLNYVAPPTLNLPSVTPAELDFLRGMADTRALASLNRSLVNLPMLFAERAATLRMVAGKVGGIADAARDIQQRDLSRWRKAAKRDKRRVARDIANEHLEIIFGWFPLIGEIEGALEYIAEERFEHVKGRGAHSLKKSVQSIDSATPISGWNPYTGSTRVMADAIQVGTRIETVGLRTNLRCDITSQAVGDFKKLGFEPISTFYDMVPLSFVSGWISNFDAYVRTLAPLIGVEFRTGSRSLRRECIFDTQISVRERLQTPPKPWLSWVEARDRSTTPYVGHRVRDERSVLKELPSASLHWDLGVGLYEAAASASLVVQRKLKPLQRLLKTKEFRYRGPKPRNLPPIRYSRP